MNEPLGYAIGNSLEVLESINTLIGKGPKDLTYLVLNLATYMVSMAKNIPLEQANKEVVENLYNGNAYKKFQELVKNQNGNLNKIKRSKKVLTIKSNKQGYIKNINALELGEIARILGAGRLNKEDKIDFEVGIVLTKKVGDYVRKEEELLKLYINEKTVSEQQILDCFTITREKQQQTKLIKTVIN